MKKRLLACALALCMAFLCACGGGSGSSSSTPAPPDNSAPAEPPVDTDNEYEDPWAIAEDLIACGLTGEDVHTMFARGEISESVLSAWIELDHASSSGGWEAADPEPELPTKPEKLEGLIFLAPSTDQSVACEVYCFNPETGDESLVSRFTRSDPFGNGHPSADSFGGSVKRTIFSSDYSKRASTKFFTDNGEEHAGWLDTDGNFFDVTEALGLQSKGDFEDPVHYEGQGFQDGFFRYLQRFPSKTLGGYSPPPQYFYVPLDNITQDAIQEGDIRDRTNRFDEWAKNGYYWRSSVTSWIDDTRCIINWSDDYHNFSSQILDTDEKVARNYIPGDSRENWNGVASPDGTQIAFMSAPMGGSDKVTDIYIIPVEGGDPVKVTGYSFALANADWTKGYRLGAKQGYVLIDWI